MKLYEVSYRPAGDYDAEITEELLTADQVFELGARATEIEVLHMQEASPDALFVDALERLDALEKRLNDLEGNQGP